VPGNPSAPSPRDGQTVMIEVAVTEGMSDTKPFGNFALNFKGTAPQNPDTAPIMRGMLRTVNRQAGDKPEFEFLNLSGDVLPGNSLGFSSTEASYVVFDDASGNTGKARTLIDRSENTNVQKADYALDYNLALVNRAKDDDGLLGPNPPVSACLNRDPATFNTQVWSYNLYTATGASVALNSGFPFTYNGKYGHVGYWGLWYDDGASTIPNGATITKQDYANKTSTPYTVKKSAGKLVKRAAETATVTSLQGVDMYFGAQDLSGSTTNWLQYRVTVDGNNDFIATDEVTWGDNGPTLAALAAPVVVTPTSDGATLWMWSDALGGNVTYVHKSALAVGDRAVTFYRQEFINAASGSGDLTVNCYTQCLKGGLTAAPATSAELFHPDATSVGSPYVYTIVFNNGITEVKDHLGNLVDFSAVDLSSLGYNYGVSTGEMINTADTTVLAGLTNVWDVYGAAVSYRWETGMNDWNQGILVIGPSGAEVFDKPLQFKYVLAAGDDRNGDDGDVGKPLMLQYGGEGQLWGFPYEQVGNRWYSKINLKDGVQLTDGSNDYLAKAIDMEKRMNPTANSDCTNAGLNAAGVLGDTSYALPAPASMGTMSITWAAKPTPADPAPAVIGGVLQ
jgi:hypothetical protein